MLKLREFLAEKKLILLFLATVITLAFLLLLLWFVPKWQLASLPPLMRENSVEIENRIEKRIELEDKVRTTWAQILGGIVVFLGIYFTWQTLYVNREGQITERFTRAIDQLGNEKLEVRLGGIYALERIARDSAKDHWSIMEVLTTYVRENAPWPPKEDRPKESHLISRDQIPKEFLPSIKEQPSTKNQQPKPKTDIQAILSVIGRRTRTFGHGENQLLNLMAVDIQGANLRGANLKGANFRVANLEGADLWGADLRNFAIEQLSKVKTLYKAKLDSSLMEQIQKDYPHLLEEPK